MLASFLHHIHLRRRLPRHGNFKGYGFAREVHGAARLDQLPQGISPMEAYNELTRSGHIRFDEHQIDALRPLERLHSELKDYSPMASPLSEGFTSRILDIFRMRKPPRGVYIYGGVGTGKSLVADIFYYCAPVKRKRRVHFHQFMLDVHKRLHERRLNGLIEGENAVFAVAEDLLQSGWLLCFDEFQVIDIADAMMLRRLLDDLYKLGAVMVTSSNRAPSELYKNGLQRDLFLPCIEAIERNCEIHAFNPTSLDYRLIGSAPDSASLLSTVWYKPLDGEAAFHLEKMFLQLADGRPIESTILKQGSRAIHIPKAAGGIAYFDFMDLCGTPKGASDYLAIAASFHTIFLANIPQMTSAHNEMVRRFITLVDVLYEQRVKLIASANGDPKDLYQPSESKENFKGAKSLYEEKDEEFAFARTISRLVHMQSSDYLSAPWVMPNKDFICHLEKSRLQEGDIRRIWDRYNIDGDAKLSRSELMTMVEDILEIKCGHRNVPEELLNDTFHKLDANKDGHIVWEEFRDYFLKYGLEIEDL